MSESWHDGVRNLLRRTRPGAPSTETTTETSQVPSPVVPDDHSPTVPRAHRVLRPKRPRASGSDGQVSCHVGLRSQPCDSDGLERPPKKLRVENINELRERITRFESLLDALEKKSLCKLQVKDWRKHIRDLSEKCDSQPETMLVLFGETGSGKSLLINALSDQRNLLQISEMAACTAVPFYVRAARDGINKYTADVEFVSEKEWAQELNLLFNDLPMGDASSDLTRQPDSSTNPVAAAAREKFKAVYGRVPTNVEELNAILNEIKDIKWLDRRIKFDSQTDSSLQIEVEKFVMSSSSAATDGRGQLWPMVKQISMFVPDSSLLQQGAVLVDLPGTGDSNSARDGVAKKYLKDCQHVVVVANIARAASGKAVKELLDKSFLQQLSMDGKGSVTVVCTFSDQVNSPTSIIRQLRLSDDPELKLLRTKPDCQKAVRRFCAQKRRKVVKDRISDDFKQEFQDNRSTMVVFTVSSKDYLDITKPVDLEEPSLFDDPNDTEIPSLHQSIVKQCQATVSTSMTKISDELDTLTENIEACIRYFRLPEKQRVCDSDAFLTKLEELGNELVQALSESLDQELEQSLLSVLKEGVAASVTVRETCWWMPRDKFPGWHSIFCAAVRRYGEYTSKGEQQSKGVTLDLNEQLLKPALETLPGCWDKLFDTNGKQSVAKLAGNFVNQWHKTVGDINSWLGDDVVKIGMVSTQFVELCTSSASVLGAKFTNNSEEAIDSFKKDSPREMKQSFKEELTECYNTAWWEARQDRVRSLPTSDELKRCLVEELRKCDGAFHAAEEKMNSCVVKMKDTLLSEARQVVSGTKSQLSKSLSKMESTWSHMEADNEIFDKLQELR